MQTCTHAAARGSQDQRNFSSVYLARVRILADMKVLYRAGSCVASSFAVSSIASDPRTKGCWLGADLPEESQIRFEIIAKSRLQFRTSPCLCLMFNGHHASVCLRLRKWFKWVRSDTSRLRSGIHDVGSSNLTNGVKCPQLKRHARMKSSERFGRRNLNFRGTLHECS